MPVFRDDVDRGAYLRLLQSTVTLTRWRCLAFCLMTNHVHLLIETPQANLSSGMQALHGRYAQTFNLRHRRTGHVFEGRYGAVLVESDAHFCATAAYVARNPVAAGLCERPEGYPWSSYESTLGAEVPDWLDSGRLLSFFGSDPDAARRAYADMVAWQL
jgi:REP element-mobilizing transposase RayT